MKLIIVIIIMCATWVYFQGALARLQLAHGRSTCVCACATRLWAQHLHVCCVPLGCMCNSLTGAALSCVLCAMWVHICRVHSLASLARLPRLRAQRWRRRYQNVLCFYRNISILTYEIPKCMVFQWKYCNVDVWDTKMYGFSIGIQLFWRMGYQHVLFFCRNIAI